MKLNYKVFGEGQPVIILHGLYGSSDNWLHIGKQLSDKNKVFLVDQRNHGNSPHSEKHNYDLLKNDLFEFIETHNIINPIIIGHSMGGKTAMFFAIEYYIIMKQLIVIDISPLSYSLKNKNRLNFEFHQTIINSLLSLNIEKYNSRKDADHELTKYIDSLPLRQFLIKNLKRQKDKFFWKINLQAIKSNVNEIMKGFDNNEVNNIKIKNLPVLFIKGEKSNYIMQEDIKAIHKIFQNLTIKEINNAGHWLHVDQPKELLKFIREFINN